MCVDLKMLKIIYRGMFPYNDEENAFRDLSSGFV